MKSFHCLFNDVSVLFARFSAVACIHHGGNRVSDVIRNEIVQSRQQQVCYETRLVCVGRHFPPSSSTRLSVVAFANIDLQDVMGEQSFRDSLQSLRTALHYTPQPLLFTPCIKHSKCPLQLLCFATGFQKSLQYRSLIPACLLSPLLRNANCNLLIELRLFISPSWLLPFIKN